MKKRQKQKQRRKTAANEETTVEETTGEVGEVTSGAGNLKEETTSNTGAV